VEQSSALAAALIHHLGYDDAALIAKEAMKANISIRAYLLEHKLLPEATIEAILNVHQVTKPGIPGKN
jgi:aspartate ammonia-lyase